MSDRWDWWNADKQSAAKPKDWQPLTPEEEARVIHLPPDRRRRDLRMSDAKSWREMSRERLQSIRDATSGKDAEQLEPGMTSKKASSTPRYTRAEMVQVLQEMTQYYGGNIPNIAKIRLYRQSVAAIPSYEAMIQVLGPKNTWPEILGKAQTQSE